MLSYGKTRRGGGAGCSPRCRTSHGGAPHPDSGLHPPPKAGSSLCLARQPRGAGRPPAPGGSASALSGAPRDRPAGRPAPSAQQRGGLTVRAESFWAGTAGSSSGSSSSSGTHILRRRQRRRARSGSGKRRRGTLLGMSLPLPTPALAPFQSLPLGGPSLGPLLSFSPPLEIWGRVYSREAAVSPSLRVPASLLESQPQLGDAPQLSRRPPAAQALPGCCLALGVSFLPRSDSSPPWQRMREGKIGTGKKDGPSTPLRCPPSAGCRGKALPRLRRLVVCDLTEPLFPFFSYPPLFPSPASAFSSQTHRSSPINPPRCSRGGRQLASPRLLLNQHAQIRATPGGGDERRPDPGSVHLDRLPVRRAVLPAARRAPHGRDQGQKPGSSARRGEGRHWASLGADRPSGTAESGTACPGWVPRRDECRCGAAATRGVNARWNPPCDSCALFSLIF